MKVEIMDTTLRDGEQCLGVSFSGIEKLNVSKLLLKEIGVDRIEVGSARVSKGEFVGLKKVMNWAKSSGFENRVEILGFVDGKKSVDWIWSVGGRVINILAKGSLKHLKVQLKKNPKEHFRDVKEVIEYAHSKEMDINVYLEDWSNGMKSSREYVFDFIDFLETQDVKRIMLPDTLGILNFYETEEFIEETVRKYPNLHFDFHAHNDYGLATANSIAAVKAGCKGIHTTVNGLGERAGNCALEEIAVALKDMFGIEKINEKNIFKVSKLVEMFSGKRISFNKPIVGENAFVQTAGIHADGDIKGNLYKSKLTPERFGRKTEYALGKLSGKASLEQNLKELGIELSEKAKKKLLERIVELGDKKRSVTTEDLPFLIEDLIESPEERRFEILDLAITTGKGIIPTASYRIKCGKKELKITGFGDGGYDAFMNGLKKNEKRIGIKLPELIDYNVRIPPGGKTDAVVETTITWKIGNEIFRTIGVDCDQVMAAIKATEKMLNFLSFKSKSKKK